MTHQVGRPPPRSALAESLLGLLLRAQAEAGYRQQEADSKALSRAAGRREVSLSLLDNPLRSFSFRFLFGGSGMAPASSHACPASKDTHARASAKHFARAIRPQARQSFASNQSKDQGMQRTWQSKHCATRGRSCARQPAGPCDARAASAHRWVRPRAQRPLPGAQPGVGDSRPRRSSPPFSFLFVGSVLAPGTSRHFLNFFL